MKKIKIGKRWVGEGEPCFIVAEISCNHMQKYSLAIKTIKAAKKAGANAIKLQTYTPETMTIDADTKYFTIKQDTIWDGQTFYEHYKKAYTPWEWQPKLKKLAEKLGLIFFSSAFDKTAVDFLEKLNVPAYKIASFEITDIPLIEYIAKKGKPIILSTGIAELEDIKTAIKACRKMGNRKIILLKCTSQYPAPPKEANLKTIADYEKRFNVIAGLSDHTKSISVPVAAIALGAKLIEKHFILNKKLKANDVKFSLDPAEFGEMVKAVREAEKSIGKVSYKLSKKTMKSRELARSLFIVKDVKEGEILTEKNIKSIRPGFGLHPKFLTKVLNKRIKKDAKKGTPLSWKLIK